ncbi:MAG: demethoxyubiquinone hydroxylase family protein [Gammaproteobacteria bacterium]|nr:MAG: demethoxyubiquinone hydroxylase family protein [Gammaproteobacteria bacterium]RLA11965.1 MAG: demethoxyubiquinone hydroxylase family protein [Gammaproteobacteria bacterium]RLA16084.1 MAG: demethoxyubiquinone hydroxylase family protein [Gammaproteobacteria bacterium]
MNPDPRRHSTVDQLLIGIQQLGQSRSVTTTPSPAEQWPETLLTDPEKRHVTGLMRVNHAGEIAAQGLYIGQAATARGETTRNLLRNAGQEEQNHLHWCHQRLTELSAKPSALTPIWHAGSILIGGLNGLRGDRWSLGFVAETEHQVEKHLSKHLSRLPPGDQRSRAIIEQMISDEVHHRASAIEAGSRALPWPVRIAMRISARVMTITAYRF